MQGQIIYEYGKNPVNYGRLEHPDFTYTEKNITCGEYLTVDFILDGEQIMEIGFEGDGRMVGIASMSLLSEELEGKSFSSVESFDRDHILNILEIDSLTPKRMRSAMLPVLTLKNAYRTLKGEEKLEFSEVLDEEDMA